MDVRVISATNRELEKLIGEGRFREDLYYRIAGLEVRTPALRERAGDVPALARHFAEAACRRHGWKPRRFSAEAEAVLARQPWKGNVRELKNVVERLLILGDADPIPAADLRQALPAQAAPGRPAGGVPLEGALRDLVDGFEREVIRERLRRHAGHVTNAARSLDLERSHLYKKCRALGLEVRDIPAWFYALVVVQQGDRFVLVEEPWGNSWSLPGGRIEGGEPFPAGAVREVQEEAGIGVVLDGIVRVEFHRVDRGRRGDGSLLRFVFAAHPTDATPLKTASDQHSLRAAWWSLEEARQLRLRTPATLGLLEHVRSGQPLYPLTLLSQRLR